MNTADILGRLQSTAQEIQSAAASGRPDYEIASIVAKSAASLATATTGVQFPPLPTPQEIIDNPLQVLTGILGDIGEGDEYFSTVQNFLTKASSIQKPEDLVNLALDEIVKSGWSLDIKMGPDGKTLSLANGSDVINIAKSALSGDIMSVQNLVMGLATKFEKEVFGFSVIETAKELDKLVDAFTAGSAADFQLGATLDMIDGLLGKVGGPRVGDKLQSMLTAVLDLKEKKMEADKIVQKALEDFVEAKEKILLPDTTEEEPETPTPEEPEETPEEVEEGEVVYDEPPPPYSEEPQNEYPEDMTEEEQELLDAAEDEYDYFRQQ